LLREDTNWDDQTRREFLMIIDEETDRLSELIDNLLDSSRLQTGTLQMDFQRVRLDTLLQEVVQRMLVRDQDLRIELDLTTTPEVVWADPTRLVQVFDNLIDNAARYAPGSEIKLSLVWQPDKVHIMIRDHGPGIPEEHLDAIFHRFFRLPEHVQKVSGSGLGLFICRQIIKAHHGEIHAESVLGEGTTFHVYLPKKQSQGKETIAFQEVPV
jgi:signal transduction histidine kinase